MRKEAVVAEVLYVKYLRKTTKNLCHGSQCFASVRKPFENVQLGYLRPVRIISRWKS
jgi:hypothetical protein